MLSNENYRELLKYRAGPVIPQNRLDPRTKLLKKNGHLVRSRDPQYGAEFYCLSPKAIDALAQFEQSAEQDTKKERQQRFQNKISVAQLFVPFITFALGIFVEHYTSVGTVVFSLFQ